MAGRSPISTLTQPTPDPVARRALSLSLPLVLVGLAWLQELIDTLFLRGQWSLAIHPGSGWWTLFTAPFSHGGFSHLLTNTLVFLPLSYLVMLKGLRAYLAVWMGVICLEIPIWLFWPVGSHGLSGVVYGLLGYLLAIGLIERRPLGLGLSVLVLCPSEFAIRPAAPGITTRRELDWPHRRLYRRTPAAAATARKPISWSSSKRPEHRKRCVNHPSSWARKRPDKRTANTTVAAP